MGLNLTVIPSPRVIDFTMDSPARRKPTKPRAWWRDCCYDHPGYATKDPNAIAGSAKGGKVKVHCKLCFEQLISRYLELDRLAVAAGNIPVVRTAEFLRSAGGPSTFSCFNLNF